MRRLQFDGESGDWFRKTLEKSPHGFHWNGFVQLRRQVSTNVYAGEYRTSLLSKGRYQKCRDHEEHVFFLNRLCQLVHVPFETSINKKWFGFRVVWVKQAPKLAAFILRHCELWESGGWVIKERIGVVRLKNVSSLIFIGDILFQTEYMWHAIAAGVVLLCLALLEVWDSSISHGTNMCREDQWQFWNDKRRGDPKETWIRLAVWLGRRPTVRRHEA